MEGTKEEEAPVDVEEEACWKDKSSLRQKCILA
jgi:hypothetical protein